MCHLFHQVAPHGPEVPNSVWNLPYGVWVNLAAEVDAWIEKQSKGSELGRNV